MNVEVNVDSSERSASVARARPQGQVTKQAKAKRAGSASTSCRSPSPKRDYPRGTCTVTRPSQASPRKAEHTVTPAQDLEAFKADMTSMLSDMLQASFQKFASQFNTNSGGQGNISNEDTVPKQSFSEPTVEVASDDDNDNSPQRGPEDQSEGEFSPTDKITFRRESPWGPLDPPYPQDRLPLQKIPLRTGPQDPVGGNCHCHHRRPPLLWAQKNSV